jgi:hypothetical protein
MGKNAKKIDHVVWHGKNGFENLKSVLKKATGVKPNSLPHKNKNVENRNSVKYKPETVEMIENYFKEEIRYFNQNICQ